MKKFTCVFLALAVSLCLVFAGCGSDSKGSVVDNAETASGTGLGFVSDLEIQAEDVSLNGEHSLGAEADAFMKGVFYFEGVVYTMENEGMPMKLATDEDKNLQLETSVEDVSVTFLLLNSQPYLLDPGSKTYIEVSERLLSILGLDTSSLTDISNFGKNSDSGEDASAITKQTAVLINGEEGLCTEISSTDKDGKTSSVKLYTVGDHLCQAENFDSDGNMTMQMAFSSFSPQIPSDQLTLSGYTKATYYTFMQNLIS